MFWFVVVCCDALLLCLLCSGLLWFVVMRCCCAFDKCTCGLILFGVCGSLTFARVCVCAFVLCSVMFGYVVVCVCCGCVTIWFAARCLARRVLCFVV